jgi:NADH:flavin oxidoreductase / NADH oxidase family
MKLHRSIKHSEPIMPRLFSSLQLRQLVLSKRIVVSSMLTNASVDGCATDWHVMHYGNLAISGMGMINFEATAVEATGRIGPRCLGLYSDEAEDALARVVRFCRANSETKLGLQLAHAGRKGAIAPDSVPRRAMTAEEGGWPVVSSSAYEDGIHARPEPLDNAGIKALIEAWKRSTVCAHRLGFDSLDLHFAHGYLVNQFLSPLINSRNDGYGLMAIGIVLIFSVTRIAFGLMAISSRFPPSPSEPCKWVHCPAPYGLTSHSPDWLSGSSSPCFFVGTDCVKRRPFSAATLFFRYFLPRSPFCSATNCYRYGARYCLPRRWYCQSARCFIASCSSR